jgi:hypothetical protein
MLVSVRAAIFLILLAFLPSGAHADKRLALLIGNEPYAPAIGALANPHNDIALLERALKGLGFEITVERDAGLGALTRAVNAYARRPLYDRFAETQVEELKKQQVQAENAAKS